LEAECDEYPQISKEVKSKVFEIIARELDVSSEEVT
jgi:hypothetical protein